MSVYYKSEKYTLYQGKMQDELENLQDNSIDSIVTDPPYGLTSITKRFGGENAKQNQYGKDGSFQRLTKGFMGKEWDGSGVELDPATWEKCLRVLKPGGYLLAFGGTRTFHRIACAIEDAGFEIRDTIMWLYGSGFPKAQDIGLGIDKKNNIDNTTGNIIIRNPSINNTYSQNKYNIEFLERKAQNEWAGWKTALKPAYEPIIVARKPLDGSCTNNVLKYGVGALNIDGCRVGTGTGEKQVVKYPDIRGDNYNQGHHEYNNTVEYEKVDNGRFPSNTILTYDNNNYFEVCSGMDTLDNTASRYFYCAKASKRDRDEGCELIQEKLYWRTTPDKDESHLTGLNKEGRFAPQLRKNTHPTVKPTSLMQYLIRLVTPSGGGGIRSVHGFRFNWQSRYV